MLYTVPVARVRITGTASELYCCARTYVNAEYRASDWNLKILAAAVARTRLFEQ